MTAAGAESRANYLLKWEAIRSSREQGATSYDLWGLATGGIAHFKTGFGGREVRYIGAWDLVLDPLGRQAYEVGAARPACAGARRRGRRSPGRQRRGVRGGRSDRPRGDARASWPTGTRGPSTRPAATSTSRAPGPSTARRRAGGRASSSPTTASRRWPSAGRGRWSAAAARTCRAGRSPSGAGDAASPRPRGWSRRRRCSAAEGSTSSPRDPEVPAAETGVPARDRGRRLPADRRDPAVAPPDVAAARRADATRRPSSRASPSRPASGSDGASEAERRVVRHDARAASDGRRDGFARRPRPPTRRSTGSTTCSLETGERRHFRSGRAPRSSPGGGRRSRAGHLVYLEARGDAQGDDRSARPDPVPARRPALDGPFRATAPSAARRHPGRMHLLRWRAIQLAIREGRDEMDLGGVDVGRRPPRAGRRATRCTACTSTSARSAAGGWS